MLTVSVVCSMLTGELTDILASSEFNAERREVVVL
jgi:hypothetical protein